MEISSQVSSSFDNTCVHVHLEGGSGVRLFLTFDKMQDFQLPCIMCSIIKVSCANVLHKQSLQVMYPILFVSESTIPPVQRAPFIKQNFPKATDRLYLGYLKCTKDQKVYYLFQSYAAPVNSSWSLDKGRPQPMKSQSQSIILSALVYCDWLQVLYMSPPQPSLCQH